jgi:hypothetical protein
MTPTNVPVSELGRQLVPAGELKPGDWLAAGDVFDVHAEVLTVHPYADVEGTPTVFFTFIGVGEAGPESTHLYAETKLELLTPAEVDESRDESRRLKVAAQLRQLATLIVSKRLPLPSPSDFDDVDVMMKFKDEAAVLAVGEALGVKPEPRYGQVAVTWPGDGRHGEVSARWYAFVPRDPKPTTVDRDEVVDADGSVPVPADVEGVAVGAGAVRQVSAPPAGGAQ